MWNKGQPSHLAVDDVELYVMDRLTESEIEKVEEHLFICADCHDLLTEVDDFVSIARRALNEYCLTEEAMQPWWRRFTTSGSLLETASIAGCGVSLLMLLSSGANPVQTTNTITFVPNVEESSQPKKQIPAEAVLPAKRLNGHWPTKWARYGMPQHKTHHRVMSASVLPAHVSQVPEITMIQPPAIVIAEQPGRLAGSVKLLGVPQPPLQRKKGGFRVLQAIVLPFRRIGSLLSTSD